MRKAATVTVTGWVGTVPREVSGEGVPFTSFRVSVAERRFDPQTREWGDGPTEWFTVKAWRDLAINVSESIRKGDPVIVMGRLRTDQWESDKGTHAGFVIEADSVGHDMVWGSGTFRRRVHRSGAAGVERVEDATPEEPAEDPWATEPAAAEVDAPEPVLTP
ncbi:single-stranded DNA-binding protein [Actinotalea sp. M2MS4P-6]|uniref:single-stranded DNA-binding protein n=1 Tax=Actinotalea sp. M2MS4P-6 TaxID=2983762 RepID=UPI0021E41C49|nr:single-stranded DNA-binding protein [Actinotalea sp. M2MS4P-6]MCV2396207.1 single-stranded DNA-binding protein [Actinotalea sp. M2MS4P-6]